MSEKKEDDLPELPELEKLPEMPDEAAELREREEHGTVPDLPDDAAPLAPETSTSKSSTSSAEPTAAELAEPARGAVGPLAPAPTPPGPSSEADTGLAEGPLAAPSARGGDDRGHERSSDLGRDLDSDFGTDFGSDLGSELGADLEPASEPSAEDEDLAPTSAPETPAEPVPVAPVPGATPAPPSSAAPRADLPPGEKPPLRELDKAPKHLRVASLIVVAGALLPFMKADEASAGGSQWFSFAAKLVVLLAAWLWLKQVFHDWGPKLAGFLGKLADVHLAPKKKEDADEKKGGRRAAARGTATVAKIDHPFPTALHALSLVLVVIAFVLSVQDPRSGMLGPVGPAEVGILGWAAFTYVHIASYERWGSFNPLFPLMFLAMLLGGIASVLAGLGAEGLTKVFHFVGGAVVAVGGGIAAYTIVEAMMQAKKEGDRKKAEALEARRAARKKR